MVSSPPSQCTRNNNYVSFCSFLYSSFYSCSMLMNFFFLYEKTVSNVKFSKMKNRNWKYLNRSSHICVFGTDLVGLYLFRPSNSSYLIQYKWNEMKWYKWSLASQRLVHIGRCRIHIVIALFQCKDSTLMTGTWQTNADGECFDGT